MPVKKAKGARFPSSELDDLTLARAKRGDREAQRELVIRYQKRVWALLARQLGHADRGRVEDLAQETFLRVLTSLDSFRSNGRAKLSTWILTISVRLVIDAQRKHQRTLPHSDFAPPRTPDQESERRALGRAIETAVESLPDEFRAAFVLRAYHHFDYQEVADALQCDVGTVKSRLSRAKKLLQTKLREVKP